MAFTFKTKGVLAHIETGVVGVTVGNGFTVTEVVAVAVHPAANEVAVTV